MKCFKKLLTVCFVTTTLWPGSSGSLMSQNGTQYTDLPPLFHMDEWSHCQRPKDIYCMVDAALTSTGPSPLLDFLKTYSADTQKHYNRTLIHRGVCISRCGGEGPETWLDTAGRCLNDSLKEYGLQAEILEMQSCNTHETEYTTRNTFAFNVVFLSLLVIIFLATGVHVLGSRCGSFGNNKYLLAFSLKRNWKILSRIKTTKTANDRTKDLICLEGIRFIGVLGVVLTHVTVVYVYSYIDNPEFIEHMFDNMGGKVAFNTPLWMQVFFSISGFLTTYLILIYSETKSFTLVKCLLSIVYRYLRLTPVALFAIWFTITWYPRLGEGPQWSWLIQREAEDCAERWWYHALYIHNYLPLGKFCMGHTWYLAADMQLHIFGMILLLVFIKWRRTVKTILCVLLIGSVISTGLIVYFFDVSPIITAQSPEVVHTMFKDSRVMTVLYLPVWMNLSGYLLGFATAFIYYYNQTSGYKLSEAKWFNLLFHSSLSIAGAVSFAGVVFLGDRKPPQWAGVLYSSFDRILVALCFNIFLLGCISNCKSILRDALLWQGFQVLGRLSYSVFIVHFIVMRFTVACNTQIAHVSAYSMIALLVVGTVLSYIIAIPVYLLIELPIIQLWKAIIGADIKQSEPEASQPTGPSKFDLVVNSNRRNVNQDVV